MEFVDSEQRKEGHMFLAIKSYEAVMINVEILLFKTLFTDNFEHFKALKDLDFITSELVKMLIKHNVYEKINKNHLISVPVSMVQQLAVEIAAFCESWNETYQEVESFNDKFHKINKLLEAIKILKSADHEIPMLPPGMLDALQQIEISN